jgi:hypothetical protein
MVDEADAFPLPRHTSHRSQKSVDVASSLANAAVECADGELNQLRQNDATMTVAFASTTRVYAIGSEYHVSELCGACSRKCEDWSPLFLKRV